MKKQLKNGMIVFNKSTKQQGKLVSSRYGKAYVSVIVGYENNGKTRKTELVEMNLSDLVPYRKPKPKKYNPNEMWYMVRDFQKAFGHPAPNKPTMLTTERILKRNSWMLEECNEMLEAETLEDQVDAAIDKLYFAIGDLVELGVKPFNLFKIVQEANMGKLWNIDGKLVPQYKEDGKVKKPPYWEEKYAPEKRLKEEIKRQSK